MTMLKQIYPLVPAKAGTQKLLYWIPAFAGMSGIRIGLLNSDEM
jgi:hypothetical protein